MQPTTNKVSKKRKLNAYFRAMLAAKKKGAKSFTYKGEKYVRKVVKPKKAKKSHPGIVTYKRA